MTLAVPRTSFVIPARNASRTLARTLDSLLAQGDGDWEALVVDDGSTDETPQLIAAHAQRDARFIALRGSGSPGAAAARNLGLQQARGRRVVFLDSDDWIDSAFLERMHAALAAAPEANVAYCDYCRVMPDGELAPPHSDPDLARTPFDTFARTCAVAINAVLIDREWVQRAGGFDTSLRTCEDWDLWQRVARLGSRWVHVAEPLAFYRASESSLSRDGDQVLADAAIVIARGFGADARLPCSETAHATGAPQAQGFTADIALAYCALWCSACNAAHGRDLPQVQQALAALPRNSEHALDIANTLLDGVVVGLRAAPRQLAGRWPDFGGRITALIDALGTWWADALAARRVQYTFERLLLTHDDLAAVRTLALTMGLRVDLRAPSTLTPPDGVDRLYVHLCEGARVRVVVEPGVTGTMSPRQWIELAAQRLGWREVMRIAGPAVARWVAPGRLAHAARSAGRALAQHAGVAASKQHPHIPVLRYRRVGDDGTAAAACGCVSVEAFAAQLAWLRQHGYHTIAVAELAGILERRRSFVDRSLIITFDEADQDFADTAWRLLRQHELRATVFTATDLVATAAACGERSRDQVPLMAAATITRLAAEGVSFGSRLGHQQGVDGMPTRDLAAEMMRSRAALCHWAGMPTDAYAVPIGPMDERLALLAVQCGYRLGFSMDPGVANLDSDPMKLPRIEVRGDMALAEFAACLEACR